jgi:hypothetical protein
MSEWPHTSSSGGVIEEAIAAIAKASPLGKYKVERKLQLIQPQHLKMLAGDIQCVDQHSASRPPEWLVAAHAVLLFHLAINWIDEGGKFFGAKQATREAYLRAVGDIGRRVLGMGLQQVRNELQMLVSGSGHIALLDQSAKNLDRVAWDPAQFTDPCHHSTAKFLYIIHAMRPETGLNVPTEEKERKYVRKRFEGFLHEGEEAWTLSVAELYFARPELMLSEVLSCSVIDPMHTTTYLSAPFGFILRAPSSNIVCASTTDMSTAPLQNGARGESLLSLTPEERLFMVDKFVNQLANGFAKSLPKPVELLCDSGHNEVLIAGTNGPHRIRQIGIFVKTAPDGTLLQSFCGSAHFKALTGAMQQCCSTLLIPIVAIPEKGAVGSDISFAEWDPSRFLPRLESSPGPQDAYLDLPYGK